MAMVPSPLADRMLPLMHRLDPERAHRVALLACRLGLAPRAVRQPDPVLATEAFGLRFENPIGLAAGFDKGAEAIAGLSRLGFGFIELGTVTPSPQSGNPRPRLFRLDEDFAIINRMGFNSEGLGPFLVRLRNRPRGSVRIGANVGVNRSGADPERDFPAMVKAVAPHSDYVAINVSSPNTPGLRDLQQESRLRAVLAAIRAAVPECPPLLVKIAPDLSEPGLEAVVEACLAHSVQGLIVSNTTTSRPPGLSSACASEAGGLSGKPLFALSTAMLARAHLLARNRLGLIGAGGVFTAEDVLRKIRAGASAVQIYTALIYEGPGLVARLVRDLSALLHRKGISRLQDIVGTGAAEMAGGA